MKKDRKKAKKGGAAGSIVILIIVSLLLVTCAALVISKEARMLIVKDGDIADPAIGMILISIFAIILIMVLSDTVTLIVSYKKTIRENKKIELIHAKLLKTHGGIIERAEEEKDFLSHLSYDIRTPLNTITGVTAIAQGIQDNPQRTTDCLARIENAARQLSDIINDNLEYSRIETGKFEILSDKMDIRDVAESAALSTRIQLGDRKLEVLTDMMILHPAVYGDAQRIRQMIVNLIYISANNTVDGGSVTLKAVELFSEKGMTDIHMEIVSDGKNLSAGAMERIWEPVTAMEKVSDNAGTGVGIAVAKQIIDCIGGKIKVENLPGSGFRFVAEIPFKSSDDYSVVMDEENAPVSIENTRILLVEDNRLNREMAVEIFEEGGAIVTTAENGEAALEMYRDNSPNTFDIIFMDVMMPVMDGLEATRQIRALEKRPDALRIPIIAMTANAMESDIRACRDAGMNAHIAKPIDIQATLKIIKNYTRL